LSKYTWEALAGGLTPDAASETSGRRIASSQTSRPSTLKSFFSRSTAVWSRWSSRLRRRGGTSDPIRHERLPDVEGDLCEPDDAEGSLRGDKAKGTTPKRRALLVGISYRHSPSNEWEHLDGTHVDVERFRELLISAYMRASVAAILHALLPPVLILVLETYGYSPEDITVLKDNPELPDSSQPSRDNMVIEPHSPFCARLALTNTPAS
jgi:hypothetical protein